MRRHSVRARVPRLVSPILERLSEPHRTHVLLAREIRYRPRHAQRTMHGARAHAAAVDRVRDQLSPGGIQPAVLAEERRGTRARASGLLTSIRPAPPP